MLEVEGVESELLNFDKYNLNNSHRRNIVHPDTIRSVAHILGISNKNVWFSVENISTVSEPRSSVLGQQGSSLYPSVKAPGGGDMPMSYPVWVEATVRGVNVACPTILLPVLQRCYSQCEWHRALSGRILCINIWRCLCTYDAPSPSSVSVV
jgi:hypothetical protein